MKKYQLGVLIIAIVTLVLAVYVISVGAKGKEDKKTFEAAQEIADDLSSYISKNQTIPESLSAAGIEDVPSSITYEKLNSKQYKFCATYNTDYGYSSGYYNLTSSFSGASLDDAAQGDEEVTESAYRRSSLYMYGYEKGENCQTIEPYIRTTPDYSNSVYCSTEELRARYSYLCGSEEDTQL